MNPTLLATKLHGPRRRRGIVARSRLTNLLRGADQPAITLVSAPAGFGKSTLLAESFADAGATAWLSLDARDNEPALFWSYLVAALQTVAPDLGDDIAAQPDTDSVVAALANALTEVPGDIVVVLDDYHAITSTALHEGMAFLLEHLPPHVHFVLATRAV